MEKLRELMVKTRSCRRFHHDKPIESTILRNLIELTRYAGSARNLQPLQYLLVNEPQACREIFPLLGWAGYLPEWPGPSPEEQPVAYIICLLDTRICAEADCDLGIASQNILLGATARGLGGCRIGSFSPKLQETPGIEPYHKILLVIALGWPKEQVVIDDAPPGGSIRYWRDAQQIHHVPKRTLTELVLAPAPPQTFSR